MSAHSSDKFLNPFKFEFSNNNQLIDLSTKSGYDLIDNKLPPNFFEKVVTTEIELSEEFDHEKLLNLFQLYLLAIQYYSLNDPPKVKPYKIRMENYFTEKDTLKNLIKFNKEKKEGKRSFFRSKTLNCPQNGMTKTHMKLNEVKDDVIKSKVKKVLKDVVFLMKIDKKNLKDIINEELKIQRQNWLEKLSDKKALMNYVYNRRKTIAVKFRAPRMGARKSFHSKINGRFQKNGNVLSKYNIGDDKPSELDDKLQNDKDETEYLDFLNVVEGENDRMTDTDYGDEESEESENSESSEKSEKSEKLEKYKESKVNGIKKYEKRKSDNNMNKSVDNYKKKIDLNGLKAIDEKEELEPDKSNTNYIKYNIQEYVEIKKSNFHSSKYLPLLVLPPAEDEDEKDIHPNNKNGKNEIKEEKKEIKEENIKEENKEKNEIKENETKEEKKEIKDEKESLNNNNIKNEINEENVKSIILARRKSITDNPFKTINIDKEIYNLIEEKIIIIDNLYYGIYPECDSNFASSRSLPEISKKLTMEQIPSEFQSTVLEIDNKAKGLVDNINKYFYLEMFDNFFLKLRELYRNKYEDYIKVNNEYHNNIRENEFMMESDENITELEKKQIQNIIDCLKEEQKDQIDLIIDKYNNKIKNYINEFKQNLFKNNTDVELMEERVKLDIYTIINEAFDKVY